MIYRFVVRSVGAFRKAAGFSQATRTGRGIAEYPFMLGCWPSNNSTEQRAMTMEEWTQETSFKGVYGGFFVTGTKYLGPRGEAGWHTTSHPNNNPIHHFWVLDSTFHQFIIPIFDPDFGNRSTSRIGSLVEDLNPAEGKAVRDAIEDWEKRELDIQQVIDEEVRRLPANSSHAFEGRTNDLTIGSDGQLKGVRRPENPEDRFE
jgi:hypothetical protein